MSADMEDLVLLRRAEVICDELWEIAAAWCSFVRDTIGSQIVRAADSVGANIAESYGRFNYGEKIQFLYYSRGSLYETKYWVNRAARRGLLALTDANRISHSLDELAKGLNAFVRALKRQRSNYHHP